ncbi:AAA family ATPase [Streptomyces sp. NBC_01324]|uniref:AAA family ATPase n=1 Tax=Streptomyces sp. NBC_01324 TaxID=2903826 RepID=UPI002E123B63|nr:AAA family ATPase [Streptomyces sp. NBC_01324]
MKRFAHGLVLGRFYPPHAGHHHLVRTAQDRCERLTVLVRAASAESVPLADRVAWMREVHPDVTVAGAVDDTRTDLRDPAVRDARMALFTAAVPEPVDAVFTSEPYGDELARRLGAEPVAVDPDRTVFPVSGTAVRADPAGYWDFLEPPVRAALARRVVVLGAESTGTTTLARALAAQYRRRGGVWALTGYVAGYGREFREQKPAAPRARWPRAQREDVASTTDDFPLMAEARNAREEAAARTGSPVLVCDTDSFAATVRQERYAGGRNPLVERAAGRPAPHLWLLTDHEGVAFEDDGPRHTEEPRPLTTDRLRAELTRTGRNFIEVTGSRQQRLATAVEAVDALLARGWHFADPLPERR